MEKNKKAKEFNFSIGADPEFAITMQGRKVDARDTIMNLLKGKKSFQEISSGYKVGEAGNIGWDGMSATGEVRPSANAYPQGVVGNLKVIFEKFAKEVNMFDLTTVSEFGSLGGHIHFQIPKGENWSQEKKIGIHRKMASFYLPIMMSENRTNLNLRTINGGYGRLTDYRIEAKFKYPDGSAGYTYEFRVPSAEWLTHPKITQATLAYLGVIYNEIINKPKSFAKFNDIMYKSDKQANALQTLSIMDFELLTSTILGKIRKYIRTFEKYPEYKAEIEYILNPKRVMKDKMKVDYNIMIGWKLNKSAVKTPTKRQILKSDKFVQSMVKDKDMDTVKKVVNINYNDDTNVQLFINSLQERIAAYNWKLKCNYFIFGMRKKMPEILIRNGNKNYIGSTKCIKTKKDKSSVDNLFNKMENRFYKEFDHIPDIITIDFKTGKPRSVKENNIIIGLPYDMRLKKDVKPFLELIHGIERGIIKEAIVSNKQNPLIDDLYSDEKNSGELYKILNAREAEPAIKEIQTAGDVHYGNNNRILQAVNELEELQERFDETIDIGNLPSQSNSAGAF